MSAPDLSLRWFLAGCLGLLAGCASTVARPVGDAGPVSQAAVAPSGEPVAEIILPPVVDRRAKVETPGPKPEPPAFVPWPSSAPPSSALPSGLFNPLPGGQLAGYWADTGLDIAANQQPVYAVAASVVEYAEAGHTRWVGRGDSRFTVRLRFDTPIPWQGGHVITHAYYGHLSSLELTVPEGQQPPTHVEAGQKLGVSGRANGSPHLHLGLLLDGQVHQDSWDFILHEADVRAALGAGPTGKRLPR